MHLSPRKRDSQRQERRRQHGDSGIYHPREIEVEALKEKGEQSCSESDGEESKQNLRKLISQLSNVSGPPGKNSSPNTYHPQYAENYQQFRRSSSANEYKKSRKRIISSRQYFSLPRGYKILQLSDCDLFTISTSTSSNRSLLTSSSAVTDPLKYTSRDPLQYSSRDSSQGGGKSRLRSTSSSSTTPRVSNRKLSSRRSKLPAAWTDPTPPSIPGYVQIIPAPPPSSHRSSSHKSSSNRYLHHRSGSLPNYHSSSNRYLHHRSGSLPTYQEEPGTLPPDDFTRCNSLDRKSVIRDPSTRRQRPRGIWVASVRRLSEEVVYSTEGQIEKPIQRQTVNKKRHTVDEKWQIKLERQLRTAERRWQTADEQLRRAVSDIEIADFAVDSIDDQAARLEFLRGRLEMERRMLSACPDRWVLGN